jgi:ribosomal protein S18 acetylase RimI-like enzyme
MIAKRCPIDRIKPEQQTAAAQTLGDAFVDDPLIHLLTSDEGKRKEICPWFMGKALAYGTRWGEVACNEDASAVAVWLPPGESTVSTVRMLRLGFAKLPFKVGFGNALGFMKALSATEEFHKTVKGPHWYLMALATSPARQGQGLGSALIEYGTAKADAAGIPCYLDTATDSNIAFYSKRGFEVVGQAQVKGYTLTGMVRQPQPVAGA